MNIKRIFCLIVSAALCFSGCAKKEEDEKQSDEKVQVTMLYTCDLPNFENLIETKYPDIDFQLEINTLGTIDGENERRLRNAHGSDLVASTLASGNVLDYLLDLSADEYIAAYQSGIMHKTARNGKNYFIPLPAQYYGYIYNVTLAEENGLTIPKTQNELMQMLEEAKKKNIGVGENGSNFAVSGAALDTATFALATIVPDFFGLAEGIKWQDGLKTGESKFKGTLEMCLDLPLEMVEKGYMDQLPFTQVSNAVPIVDRMIKGELLMAFDNVNMLKLIEEKSSDYKFDMLPVFSNKDNPEWTISAPTAFLGINGMLAEEGSENKLKACRNILNLLSTPEGQEAFMKDNGAAYSYLVDYAAASESIPDGIKSCIEDGYNFNISIPTDFMRYFGNCCNTVLCGQKEISEAFDELDAYVLDDSNQSGSLIGTIGQDMIVENYNVRLGETEIGNLIADAVREQVDTDIAVVNGGSIRGSLYKGDIYSYDLDYVCPYENNIIVLEVNADVIRDMLSNGLSAMVQDTDIPGGRFLNVSGLKYSFTAPTADKPAQLVDVTLADGSPLDENSTYTIAVTNYMAGINGYIDNNGDGYTMLNVYSDETAKGENVKLVRETEYTFSSVLENYIINHNDEEILSQIEGRITAVSGNE